MPSHSALADTRRFLKTLHALHSSPALPARPSAELALHPISQVTQREIAHKPTAEYHPAGSDVYRTSLSCLFRLNEEQLLCKCDFSTCSLIRVAAAISFWCHVAAMIRRCYHTKAWMSSWKAQPPPDMQSMPSSTTCLPQASTDVNLFGSFLHDGINSFSKGPGQHKQEKALRSKVRLCMPSVFLMYRGCLWGCFGCIQNTKSGGR